MSKPSLSTDLVNSAVIAAPPSGEIQIPHHTHDAI